MMQIDGPLVADAVSKIIDRVTELEAALARRDRRIAELEAALERVVAEWVNPGDGAPFEDGEVPALDQARSALTPDGEKS